MDINTRKAFVMLFMLTLALNLSMGVYIMAEVKEINETFKIFLNIVMAANLIYWGFKFVSILPIEKTN